MLMDEAGETFGEVLRRLRGDLPLREVGRRATVSLSHVWDLEKDRKRPSPRVAESLDRALNADGALIAAMHTGKRADQNPDNPRLIAKANKSHNLDNVHHGDEEDPTKRRRLLQLAAGVGVGAVGSPEPLRQLIDLAANAHRTPEDWDAAATAHLHALRTRPPTEVIKQLSIDLYFLREQLARPRSDADRRHLFQVAALLAGIQANAFTRTGDHGDAIRWSYTARKAADISQNLEVRLLVRGEEAILGLYGQRAPEDVLTLVRNATQIIATPWPRLVAAKAKALAMLGRHDEAATALRALHDLVERGIRGDRLGWWMDDQLFFAQSWVYSAAGREAAADTARDHMLKVTAENSFQYRTNIHLHEAICTVTQGGVTRGVRQATELLDALPAANRTVPILETARRVLHAVPFDQRSNSSVRDLRSLLTTAD
ncbi:transcriptional regulator with XRE-family HTH domain [Sphaerisporangium rubeum]|uniref:Transcriptional regulator with XRE-family HTH domain n=1 Tax=Sphaerisporangium rubeum TaxID=321317 RepID=A0A7X0M958_9ACTN|nr:transcriptional regulator with XRE-family HTH domain [Sphaerisporangium rubeum]